VKLKERLGDENEKRELERDTFQIEVCVVFLLWRASQILGRWGWGGGGGHHRITLAAGNRSADFCKRQC
jgi:hypothetical protein